MSNTRTNVDVPAVVVSADSHVGPRLQEELRGYCPKRHLASYDEMLERHLARQRMLATRSAEHGATMPEHPNPGPGHYDADVRLQHMDDDGVAAEVIYHFSQNGEPMPWIGLAVASVAPEQFELAEIAYDIYNRWLADFCSADPERLLGLVYVPTWNIDKCVETITWARDAGLRGVNFPPPSKPGVLEYNNLAWEPFWSACEDLGVVLHSHANGATHLDYMSGPGGIHINLYETAGFMSRRAVHWLVLGMVFERHPELRLIQSEQTEGWFVPTMQEMDSLYLTLTRPMSELPRLPSEYMREHVFFGASFVSRAEVEAASRDGWATNLIWGRDYPHSEGCYRALDDPSIEPYAKQAMRHVFCTVPTDDALLMLGQNGVRVLGLDGTYLADVARRIDAITPRHLQEPLDDVPDVDSFAFVGYAGPRPLDEYRIEWSDRRAANRSAVDA